MVAARTGVRIAVTAGVKVSVRLRFRMQSTGTFWVSARSWLEHAPIFASAPPMAPIVGLSQGDAGCP